MKIKYLILVLIFVLVCLPVVPAASSAAVSFAPAGATVQPGGSTNFTLLLDSAPNGLAGYNLNVVLSNPGAAQITGASFPAWATLNNVTYPSPGTVKMSGVDLGRVIPQGATNVELGTVTIRGISAGSTTISINSVRMNAQGGANMDPAVSSVTLTVQGGTTSGGSSYAGGGGGGGYSGTVNDAGYTSSSENSGNGANVQEPAGTVPPGNSSLNSAPMSTSTVPTTQVASNSGATPFTETSVTAVPAAKLPGSSPAQFPWMTIIGIFVVLGIIGAAVVLYFVKKEKLS